MLDLFVKSQRRLLAVSFAAHKMPAILEALGTAASRGVEVMLVFESADVSAGTLSFDSKEAFVSLEGRPRFYSWPLGQRGPPNVPHGTLHTKAVVADGERALVTSPNLTGPALELNMELGLLVEGGPIPNASPLTLPS